MPTIALGGVAGATAAANLIGPGGGPGSFVSSLTGSKGVASPNAINTSNETVNTSPVVQKQANPALTTNYSKPPTVSNNIIGEPAVSAAEYYNAFDKLNNLYGGASPGGESRAVGNAVPDYLNPPQPNETQQTLINKALSTIYSTQPGYAGFGTSPLTQGQEYLLNQSNDLTLNARLNPTGLLSSLITPNTNSNLNEKQAFDILKNQENIGKANLFDNGPLSSLGYDISSRVPLNALTSLLGPNQTKTLEQVSNTALSQPFNQLSNIVSPYINNFVTGAQSTANRFANTPYYNPYTDQISPLANLQNALGTGVITAENLFGGKYNNIYSGPNSDLAKYANFETQMQNLVNQGIVSPYFPTIANLLATSPLLATGIEASPTYEIALQNILSGAGGLTAFNAAQNYLTGKPITTEGLVNSAVSGGNIGGILSPFSSILSGPLNNVINNAYGIPSDVATNFVGKLGQGAFNLGNFFALQTIQNSLQNGVVPTKEDVQNAYLYGSLLGTGFETASVLGGTVGTTLEGLGDLGKAISPFGKLATTLGASGVANAAIGSLSKSKLTPEENFAIGALGAIAPEIIKSYYDLGTAGISKVINPDGSVITFRDSSGKTLATATFDTDSGKYNIELYPSTGASPKYTDVSTIQAQLQDAVDTNPDLAQSIHTTDNPTFYKEASGTTYVGAPLEEGKGFRQIAAVDQYGNPLYGSTPTTNNEGVVNRAYLGYGAGESNAESSKIGSAEASPNTAYGLRFKVNDAITPEVFAQTAGLTDQLNLLRKALSDGESGATTDAAEFYQQYQNYARSQGVPLYSPVSTFFSPSEQEIVLAPGTVIEGIPGSKLDTFVIQTNQGLFKDIPILENLFPTTLKYYTQEINPLATLLTESQLNDINSGKQIFNNENPEATQISSQERESLNNYLESELRSIGSSSLPASLSLSNSIPTSPSFSIPSSSPSLSLSNSIPTSPSFSIPSSSPSLSLSNSIPTSPSFSIPSSINSSYSPYYNYGYPQYQNYLPFALPQALKYKKELQNLPIYNDLGARQYQPSLISYLFPSSQYAKAYTPNPNQPISGLEIRPILPQKQVQRLRGPA